MNNTPRKAILPLLGIAALAALILIGIRPATPFHDAARRLRLGMTKEQVIALLNLDSPTHGHGSPHDWYETYRSDSHETLELNFQAKRDSDDRIVMRLLKWTVESD